MASLLVHVAPERAHALVTGGTQLDRTHLPEPALDRLDDDDTLFVFTTAGAHAIIVAVIDDPWVHDGKFAGGDALFREHDITELLPRLGCNDPTRIAEWAASPRVLPPSDVDLLRYALDLDSIVRPPPAPEPI